MDAESIGDAGPANGEARNNHSADELFECVIEDYYHFYEDFALHLAKALSHVSRDTADRILNGTFSVPFYGDSWHFAQTLIHERSVVIIDSADLEDEEEAIVTILHEAGHSFLGHGTVGIVSLETMQTQEDECWSLVREWLPGDFAACIDKAVQQGSGTKGEPPTA